MKHLGKCVKVDVLVSYQTTFPQICEKERPFLQYQNEAIFWKWNTSHLAPCSRQLKIRLLQGITGNKCCLHQLLRWECQGSGAVSLLNLLMLKREVFCLHQLLTKRGETFFPQFGISGLYTMPSRKPTLRNSRESREICCNS